MGLCSRFEKIRKWNQSTYLWQLSLFYIAVRINSKKIFNITYVKVHWVKSKMRETRGINIDFTTVIQKKKNLNLLSKSYTRLLKTWMMFFKNFIKTFIFCFLFHLFLQYFNFILKDWMIRNWSKLHFCILFN